MAFWKYLTGMVTVEFTSASPEELLDQMTQSKIILSRVVQKNDLTYQIQIHRKDYDRLSKMVSYRGDHLKITKKQGLYWPIQTFLHRPVLLTVFILLFFASLYLPTRIFFISVDGNTVIPDQQILSAAENCGIRFAASRKLVRSEKVKNALLSSVPQLQWAGVNTSGCTAVISVRERAEEENPAEKKIVSNLIADRDGFILSATVTSGTAHCTPGETVTKGQLLVSGYTDCDLCIRGSRAEGEIIAQTNRHLQAVMPKEYRFPDTVTNIHHGFSLLIGKKRINLWKDSSISDACCGRMYKEYYLSLPGGFRLPVAFCSDRFFTYETQEATIPKTDAQLQLQYFSDRYLLSRMVAGQIIRKQQKIVCTDNRYLLESNYTCTEMIGKEQREQIGVINGKRN